MSTDWQALSDFVNFHGIKRDQTGRCSFRADVSIAGKETAAEVTTVIISFHNGDANPVRIAPSGYITTARFHTEFNPDYQTISFTAPILKIDGFSAKMGTYTVTIEPAH